MPFITNLNIGTSTSSIPPQEDEDKNQYITSDTFGSTLSPTLNKVDVEEPVEYDFTGGTSPVPSAKDNYGLGYNYNTAELRNNEEVGEIWQRLHASIGLTERDNDMIEYFRDAEYSIGSFTGSDSIISRGKAIAKMSAQDRKDYTTLKRLFENTGSLGNTKERLKFAGNLAGDILGDPFNWASLAVAIPTMGQSFTAQQAAGLALRAGINKATKSQLTKEAIKNTGTIALYGSGEGMAWGGAYEFFSQGADIELGTQKGPVNWKKVGQVAALGGAFGAVVPGAIGGISNTLFIKKLFNASNENSIYNQAAKKIVDNEKKIDVNMSNPSSKIVFFKNQKGSKGKQKTGAKLEIIPLTRKNYKQYILAQSKSMDKETFKQIDSFAKFLKYNDLKADDAFLVIRHSKNKSGKITKTVNPMKELEGSLSAVSKKDIETYFNKNKTRRYWKEVTSFRDKKAIAHAATDDESVEALLYARQAGVAESTIVRDAKKYGIDIAEVDKAAVSYFKNLINGNATLDVPDIGFSLLHTFIARTTGKATTKYMKLADNNEALTSYLESLVPGATNKLLKRRKTGVNEFTYSENKGSSDGFYLANLDLALNRLNKSNATDNDQLLALIMSGGNAKKYGDKVISKRVKTAYFGDGKRNIGVRNLLKKAFDDGDESGLFAFSGQVKDYFPHKLQHSKIEKDREAFEDLLIQYGHADPMNELKPQRFYNSKGEVLEGFAEDTRSKDMDIWGRDFMFDSGQNLDKARELKAAAIVDDMLERRWTPYQQQAARQPGGNMAVKGGHGFMKHRVFDKIPDEKMLPYIETDVSKVLQDYFVNFSQANVRTKMYGRNIEAMKTRGVQGKQDGIFARIEDEFIKKGGSRSVVKNIMEELEKMHGLVTGLDHNSIKNNKLRTLSDWGKLSQQMAHLPMATLSSLTEPLLLLSRARPTDALNVSYDIANSMKKQTQRTFNRMAEQSRKVSGKKTNGLDEFDDDEWFEIYQTGLALEQATMERIEGLTGEALSGSIAKGVQNAFFKTNLLTQWTSAVQLASFTTGKRLIKKNIASLHAHNEGTKKLSKKTLAYYSDQLEELGVPLDQANSWYKRYLNSEGVFDFANADKDSFFKQRILRGANRFTREIILNPSTSSANRPLWFSHPAGQLLMQFAGYPTVFNNTILKRFVYEAKEYPLQTTPKLLATTMLMTSIAMMGNYIRTGGRNWEEQEPKELITHGIRRWGGYGAYEYFDKTEKNLRLGSGQAGALLKLGGPLPADVVDALLYRKGITEFATTNVPGYSALPKETRDYLKKIGRDRDKALIELFIGESEGKGPKRNLARGGLVDVPNAKDEPDEMINKFTGLPYNATSTSAQDIEDRERRADGSDGAEKGELPDILKPLGKLVARMQGKVREGKEMLDLTKEILSSTDFRLYSDAVIKRKKDTITKDWFTEEEFNSIKADIAGVFKNSERSNLWFSNAFPNEPLPIPRVYDKSKNINKDADKISVLHGWMYSGDGNISMYETLGTSTLNIPHKESYDSAVLEVYDEYDFNSIHGGSDGYLKQGTNIVRSMLNGNAGSLRAKAMQLAEKYGAYVLPDDRTATLENREPQFVPVSIKIPVSDVMDKDTWKSYQANITYQQSKPNVTPKPQRPNMLDNDFEVVTTDQDRQGFESGGVSGVVKRVIDFGGEVMGVGEVEQRANEKQAAAIVNQMVAAGTVPKYEYVPVDDYNFPLQGDKSDTFEAVNHGLLSATYGDSMFRRGALQVKEVAQGFGRPLDSKRDSYNNRVGFKIRETSKTPEEISQQINNRIIRSYEKMNSGEALIPGEDFFLNPNEMEQ